MAMRGPFKRQALSLLRARNVPVVTIIDVGVGHATNELIEVFPDCHHVLIEPVAEFAPMIAANYAHIPHTLVTAAAAERNGETGLAVTSFLPGVAISHAWISEGADRVVPMVSLDSWLARNPCGVPLLIKIDVDGCELGVLRGAASALAQASIVIVEVTPPTLVERTTAIAAAGLELFDLVDPCYHDGALWQADAIMVRRELFDLHFARAFDIARYEEFVPAPSRERIGEGVAFEREHEPDYPNRRWPHVFTQLADFGPRLLRRRQARRRARNTTTT